MIFGIIMGFLTIIFVYLAVCVGLIVGGWMIGRQLGGLLLRLWEKRGR